ncbi:hypothetical protein ALC56_03634 [Trachymyrmex septentrionalis]|uniref:Uncharacterized protein n=1 Tax=Trachymyrmex septentrionalis TaxID=34720 RepID=A0A151JZM4_9HYME|nr:hypothetical protein ALC56_03634 [Trachymyrmex septentrionalis]
MGWKVHDCRNTFRGREWSDDGGGGDDEREAIPRDTKRVLKRTRGRCRDVA